MKIPFWKNNIVLLIIATCLWGGNFVVGKVMVDEVPPITLALFRWITALIVVLPFFGFSVWEERKLYLKHWRIVLFLALTGLIGFNTIVYYAVHHTSSINASLMNAATPIVIVLMAMMFLKERFSFIRLIGILVSLFGVIWVSTSGSLHALLNLKFNHGDLWMILAVICWAMYSIAVRKTSDFFPAQGIFAITILITVILLTPMALMEITFGVQKIIFSWTLLGGVLYIGIFASVVAFTCWNLVVSQIGPSRSSSFLNLIPLFSAIFATTFISEKVQAFHLIGAVLIICGVYITTKLGKNDILSIKSK